MTRLLRALIAVLCLTLGIGAQGRTEPGHADDQHGATRSTMEMENKDFFVLNFHHLQPVVVAAPEVSPNPAINKLVTFYNVNLYQVFIAVALFGLFGLVLASFRNQTAGGPLASVCRMLRGFCHWLRDEVVYKVMGEEEGAKWAPLFLYLFFFVAFMNIVGLVPGSVTSTACIFVTAALSIVTLVLMVGGGMLRQGPIAFWKNLVPHGLPVALLPLMALVEVVGLIIKPMALTVRLFANMLAGHLLIYSFIGLIFVLAKMLDLGALAWATAIPTLFMAIFINIIEALVVLLQAYIFTYLSVMFVQQSLHPEH